MIECDLSIESALSLLRVATHESSGTYTMLRSGEAPTAQQLQHLIAAGRLMELHFKDCEAVPRLVTLISAIFMHFAGECERNLRSKSAPHYCVDAVLELEQIAFNTLAE